MKKVSVEIEELKNLGMKTNIFGGGIEKWNKPEGNHWIMGLRDS